MLYKIIKYYPSPANPYNGAKEGSSIDLKIAQEELEKVTLLVDEATTKKEKIEATIELRKAKARLQAVA